MESNSLLPAEGLTRIDDRGTGCREASRLGSRPERRRRDSGGGGANAGAEGRSAPDGGRAAVERGLGWKLRTQGFPRWHVSPQYWPGCPFQDAVHGQSGRAYGA
eukprot:1126187-Prymnesium_polylepis.1